MANRVRDFLLRITGDPSDAQEALHTVARELGAFDRIEVEATADVNVKPAEAAISKVTAAVQKYGAMSETAKVDLQITGAEAQLDRLKQRLDNLGRKESSPKIDIAIARAVGQIDQLELKLDRLKAKRVEVDVDVDRRGGAGGLLGGIAEGASGLARGLATAGTTVLTFFSSLARGIPIVGGIGQAFAGLGTSAAAAGIALVVIVPIAIALVGALTLLGGAVVALGASLLAAAAGVGVLATAFAAALGPAVLVAIAVFARFAKILEAVKQHEDQAATSAKAIGDATHRQADAQQRLEQARKTAAQAAVEGYRAQRDAAEEVSDAVRGIADAELNREQAGLDLKKDEQALKDFRRETGTTSSSLDNLFKKFSDVSFQPKDLVGAIRKSGLGETAAGKGGTALDLAQLVLNLKKDKQGIANADDAVSDARTRANDARQKEAEFLEKGIAAYPPYTAALEGVKTATQDVADAQKNLNDTRDAQDAKLKELGPKEQRLADVLGKVKASLADAFRPATDRVFTGVINLLKSINAFAKDPQIRRALGGIGDAIGKVLTGFGKQINTREFKRTFVELAKGGRDIIRLFGSKVFGNVLTLLLRIARSALPPMLDLVRKIADRFDDWVKGLGQKGVEGFVKRVIRSFNSWKGVIKEVWGVIKEFFGDANDKGDTLADHIADILRDFRKWLHENPDGIKQFFEDAKNFALELLDTIRKILPLLKQAADFATTAGQEIGLVTHPGRTAGEAVDLITGKAERGAADADTAAEAQAKAILANPRESAARKRGAQDTLDRIDAVRRRRRAGRHTVMRALGGAIPGVGRGDTVPVMAEPGEYMLRRSVAQAIGLPRLDALNAGALELAGVAGAGISIAEQTIVLPPAPGHDQLGDPRHQAAMLARELRRRGHAGVGGGGFGA